LLQSISLKLLNIQSVNGWSFVAAAIFRKRKKRYLYPSNKDVTHVIATQLDQPVAVIAAAEIRSVGKDRLTQSLRPRSYTIAIITWSQTQA